MAALRTGSSQRAPAFRARENLSKQQMHRASPLQQRRQQAQLNKQTSQGLPRPLHARQGLRAQQQGPIPANLNQQRWQGYSPDYKPQGSNVNHAYKQQEPNSQQAGNRQEQGHAHPQYQQSHCQARFQADVLGKAQHYQQPGESPMHVQQQECAHQNQGQDGPHCHRPQSEYHSTAYQPPVDVDTQKQQSNEARSQQPGQIEVPIQQQDKGHWDAHHQGQDQETSYFYQQQQRQGGYTSTSQEVDSDIRCQGQTNDHQRQDVDEACANKHRSNGKLPGSLQMHDQACAPEQYHSQEYNDKQQGLNEGSVHQQQEERKEACLKKSPVSQEKSVFWTACPYCKMQFEYERAYMNKKLCCPMCYGPFFSKQILPLEGRIIWQLPTHRYQKRSEKETGRRNGDTDISDGVTRADFEVFERVLISDREAKGEGKDNATSLKLRKTPEVALSAVEGKYQNQEQVGIFKTVGVPRPPVRLKYGENGSCASKVGKTLNISDEHNSRLRNFNMAQTTENQFPFANADGNNSRVQTRHSTKAKETEGFQHGFCLSNLSALRMEVSEQKRKSATFSTEPVDDLSHSAKRLRRTSSQSEPTFKSDNACDNHQLSKHSKSSDDNLLPVCVPKECEMEVPDSDFYNFDDDRTERHFSLGQIWATYDDDDGMPRYYARVNKIISITPFKLQMNWLEARNPTDETLEWLGAGLQHICGDFMLGSVYVADQVSTFSHLMKVDKVAKGHYKIYPRKGEVWAVYKGWEFLKVREDHREYEMVEIIATYDEKRGVQVATLFKVTGFKTIFESKPGKERTKWIPVDEMRRFSHQVPAHFVEAGKVPGIQNNCLEIDPASTPMDLITGIQ